MNGTTWILAALAVAGALAFPAAQAADDKAALAGVTELKAIFDIREGNATALLNRLDLIDETRRTLIAQGVKPRFVLAFRGPATRLIQTDMGKVRPEDRALAPVIATRLDEMRDAAGIEGIELCAVAIRGQGTKTGNVIPAVRVVGNTWISLMAYQARGYAYISP